MQTRIDRTRRSLLAFELLCHRAGTEYDEESSSVQGAMWYVFKGKGNEPGSPKHLDIEALFRGGKRGWDTGAIARLVFADEEEIKPLHQVEGSIAVILGYDTITEVWGVRHCNIEYADGDQAAAMRKFCPGNYSEGHALAIFDEMRATLVSK